MNTLQDRDCPICGSSEKKLYISSGFAADQSADDFAYYQNLWYGLDKSIHFLSYHNCLNCNAVYCPRYFTEESLNELYKSMPPNMELIADHLIQKTQARYALSLLKSIEKWYLTKTSQKFTILELGSDTGHFLVELINLLQKKFDVDAKEITIVSIEPNVAVHATLKNNLEKLGVNFEVYATFEQYENFSNSPSIDIIVAIHVFDHLLNPKQILKEISKHCSGEFFVYGVVHNLKSILRNLMGRRWPPFCFQHPQLYSKQSLPQLFTHSFKVESLSISPTFNDYPLSVITSFLKLDFLTKLVKFIYLTIPLGNIQFICKGYKNIEN